MTLKVAVIGLGRQSVENHLPALKLSNQFQLTTVVDSDPEKVSRIASEHAVSGFSSIEDMLSHEQVDVAVIALPHSSYLRAISLVARRGVHIIKEKPFATSLGEAIRLQSIIKEYGVYIGVTMQRRFNPIFQSFHQLKRRVGKIYSIEGHYTMNIPALDEGWRASKSSAGGGALLDMGYHFIDLLVWYFGVPFSVTARLTRGNRPDQIYDVEDTAHLLFDYHMEESPDEKTLGSFVISRVYPQKEESLIAYGTEGIIELKRGCIRRLDNQGGEIERLERYGSWPSSAIDQLEFFATQIRQFQPRQEIDLHEHLAHTSIIEAAYESDRIGHSCSPHSYLKRSLGMIQIDMPV